MSENNDDKNPKDVVEIFPEINALQLTDGVSQLVQRMPEHAQMLSIIQKSLPEIQRSSSLFYKTQSQFMDNMLTVSHHTPLRNLRQILAEMNKTREAIKELHFKTRKKEVKLKMKQRSFEDATDPLKKELLEIEIFEIMSGIDTANGYLSGAIRKLANYTEQYMAIKNNYDLTDFNEADFEKEEERYHIMKAFEQAMCAARTRHDHSIDEGNMIYLTQIGINGASAQLEISNYLRLEQTIIQDNSEGQKEPTHRMYLMFLERMADKYTGSSIKYAEYKGLHGTVTESALLLTGDMSALQLTKKPSDE